MAYIYIRQVMVAKWVDLCTIFEVCVKEETRYKGGGQRQSPWWQHTAVDNQLRATLKYILEDASKQRRQESVRNGERGDHQGAVNDKGMEGYGA